MSSINNSTKPQSNSPANKMKGNSQRQSLVVKTQLQNSFDSRWAQIKIAGKNIWNRSNHAAGIWGDKLYILGGYDVDKGILADFHSLTLLQKEQEYQWQVLPSKCDQKPIKLKNHTCVNYKQSLYFFGGEVSSSESSNLTYVFNIPQKKWSVIKPNIQIPRVDSHCSALINNKMYVYSGYIPQKAELMANIYALDLDTKNWELIFKAGSKQKQTEPEGRSNSSMVGYQDSLYVFGGTNGIHTLNDFWKFSLTKKSWQKIQTKNTPSERRGHSMVLYNKYIFMFGGIQDITKQKNDVYIYEFASNSWQKIHTTTNSIYDCSPTLKRQKKESRSPDKISLMKISPQKNGQKSDAMKKILNQNKQKKFQQRKKQLLKQFSEKPGEVSRERSFSPTTQSMVKTLQAIGNQQSTRKQAKQEVIYDDNNRKIIGKKPCARDGQTVCLKGDFMYIFGGDRHLMAFNDLYEFDLAKGVKSLQLYSNKK